MSHLRKEVLKQFKQLHRTREQVFQGDSRALNAARDQINQHFKQNKSVSDEGEIKKMIKVAKDVEVELKINVVQAAEKEPGVFHVRVSENTPLLDNFLFNERAEIPKSKGRCCDENQK